MNSRTTELLKALIACPSVSGSEEGTANILEQHFRNRNWNPERYHNNVIVRNAAYDSHNPSLLLCAHHDTVAPSISYCRDPFFPIIENGRLYGLGSNDDGGSLVCMIEAFAAFYDRHDLPFNLILDCSAEEEVSGKYGISSMIPHLSDVIMAIVGEPTSMQAAIAERGLLVIDGFAKGTAGHAARGNGDNALYKALDDIQILRDFHFPQRSAFMGPVSLQVTQIQAGSKHNVIPDVCNFVVDIRPTDGYSNTEILEMLQKEVSSTLTARNLLHRASATPANHPLLQAIEELNIPRFVSSTTSDWVNMPFPAIKIGPGDSLRSHCADEFITLEELETGLRTYIQIIYHLASKSYANTLE